MTDVRIEEVPRKRWYSSASPMSATSNRWAESGSKRADLLRGRHDEAKYKGLFMIGNIPDGGSMIRLRVDPADPRHFEAVTDDDGDSSYPRPQPSGTIIDQLQRLSALHRRILDG